jgi:metal-responsive CopG/Arc/MetJ family transcriptional regulator
MHVKPVQIMFDDDLLARLSASPDVEAEGRSAVVRRAVRRYLHDRERAEISEAYRRAYSDADGLDDELVGWTRKAWPPD